MKTVLVVFVNDANTTVEKANSLKMKKYCFLTDSNIQLGDILTSSKYTNKMLVTDVLNKSYNYYNKDTGELSYEVTSTNCYPIKKMELREEDAFIVYAQKVSE